MADETIIKIHFDDVQPNRSVDTLDKKLDGLANKGVSAGHQVSSGFGLMAGGAIKAVAAIAGVTLGLSALKDISIDAFRETVNLRDSMWDLHLSSGVAVETLSRWRVAGDLSGISMQTLATAFKFANRSILEAARGTGEAAEVFDILKMSVYDASGKLKTADQIILEFSDKLAGIEDPATRAGLTLRLLGRSGDQMLPFLLEGREGLERLAREAERAGVAFDEKAARKADELNDSLSLLKFRFEGLKAEIAEGFIPIVETGIGVLNRLIDAMKRAHPDQFNEEYVKRYEVGIAALGQAKGISAGQPSRPWFERTKEGDLVFTPFESAGQSVTDRIMQWFGLGDTSAMQAALDQMKKDQEEAKKTGKGAAEGVKLLDDESRSYLKTAKEMLDPTVKIRTHFELLTKNGFSQADALRALRPEVEAAAASYLKLGQAIPAALLALGGGTAQLREISKGLKTEAAAFFAPGSLLKPGEKVAQRFYQIPNPEELPAVGARIPYAPEATPGLGIPQIAPGIPVQVPGPALPAWAKPEEIDKLALQAEGYQKIGDALKYMRGEGFQILENDMIRNLIPEGSLAQLDVAARKFEIFQERVQTAASMASDSISLMANGFRQGGLALVAALTQVTGMAMVKWGLHMVKQGTMEIAVSSAPPPFGPNIPGLIHGKMLVGLGTTYGAVGGTMAAAGQVAGSVAGAIGRGGERGSPYNPVYTRGNQFSQEPVAVYDIGASRGYGVNAASNQTQTVAQLSRTIGDLRAEVSRLSSMPFGALVKQGVREAGGVPRLMTYGEVGQLRNEILGDNAI